ncbi:MAG: acyltransferase family protein [Eubacteriales bacterium]|nr:acyltransferase family protein [Eubacteriales bacterium]
MKRSYIDWLNVLASFAVVMLHNNEVYWWFSDTESYWVSANVIESIFYFATPIFMMNAGATLLSYRQRCSTFVYFKRRWTKTVAPFFLWSLLGIAFGIVFLHQKDEYLSIAQIINAIFQTRIINYYWYFIPLFAIYLAIPVLAAVEEKLKNKVYSYLLFISVLLTSTLPLLCNVLGLEHNADLASYSAFGYMLFPIAGYLLDRVELKRPIRLLLYGLGLTAMLCHMLITKELSFRQGSVAMLLKGYTNLPSVLYAFAVFTFFRYARLPKALDSFIHYVSAHLTYGVYLIHWYVIHLLVRLIPVDITSLSFRLIGGVAIYVFSALLVFLIRKIPILKRLLPS